MPYKDPQMQRKAVREAVRRYRARLKAMSPAPDSGPANLAEYWRGVHLARAEYWRRVAGSARMPL